MNLFYAAVVTQTLIACLSGQMPVVRDADTQSVLYCPAYFGLKTSNGELGVYNVPTQYISADEFCEQSQDWCDAMLLSSLPVYPLCPNLFPVGTAEQDGVRWYGMYFYRHPDCPSPAKIEKGQGVVILFVQTREMEFLDASEFFAPPQVPAQLVPADVVNSVAIDFLPPDRIMKMGRIHIISLVVGLCLIAGFYVLWGPSFLQLEGYSGD